MDEIIQFLNERLMIVEEEAEDFLSSSKDDYFEGKVHKSILTWDGIELKRITRDEVCTISLSDWEELVRLGKYYRTRSEFLSYLDTYFLLDEINPITKDGYRGLMSLIEAVDSFF